MTNTAHDDDTPLDPAEMLALVQRQQGDMQRRMARYVPWILLSWALAWGVGFGMLWLVDGARPGFSVPLAVAGPVFGVLLVGAGVTSGVLGARSGRGIRSSKAAEFTGTTYGVTWSVGLVALFALGASLTHNGASPEVMNIFYPAVSLVFVGVMYIIAGAIWHAIPSIWMGGAIVAIAVIGSFFGYPTHYLVYAILGGGVFLAGAVVTAVYSRTIVLKGL
ncbi:hypothetical protein FB562_0257 [Homoserinimonas aerilata]|uniref:Uncharacterized protein n=1 Tax=Homoserinimonas aerilata TaxID=1162970 RepID=A0A542YGK5_9MICO|nr:hypothetical protein [Homoserinimonas aerilata]TQL47205.1 hypothetical protein FB562_0257 [Homoserinimonas aerilata]